MRDWSNADDYAFTKDLKPWQWAWQFLRRNPDYQADFQAVLEIFHRREDGYSQQVSKKLSPGEEPESIPNAECRQKWFVCYYLNPRIEFPGDDPFGRFADFYMSNRHRWPLQLHEALLRVNLRLPLSPQLKQAHVLLAVRQRNMASRGEIELRTPRNRRDHWKLYLRLLDGIEAGASYKALARILPPARRSSEPSDESRVDSHLQQARRMTREGYRDILLTAKPEFPGTERVP